MHQKKQELHEFKEKWWVVIKKIRLTKEKTECSGKQRRRRQESYEEIVIIDKTVTSKSVEKDRGRHIGGINRKI